LIHQSLEPQSVTCDVRHNNERIQEVMSIW